MFRAKATAPINGEILDGARTRHHMWPRLTGREVELHTWRDGSSRLRGLGVSHCSSASRWTSSVSLMPSLPPQPQPAWACYRSQVQPRATPMHLLAPCPQHTHQPHCLFQSIQSLSHVLLFVTPWTAERQASLAFSNSQSLLKLMSIESVILSNHLALCYPLLFLPPISPSIRVFSSESVLHI